jgi:hypothetical protein
MGSIRSTPVLKVSLISSHNIAGVLICILAYAYCQDHETGAIYLHGQGSKLANMDVDCDGDQSDHGDGRCGNSNDTQSITAFQYLVAEYSKEAGHKVSDVNANFIPYVVFGNQGSKKGYTTFHPQSHGIKPLSVMAVVCGKKLVPISWILHACRTY